MKVVHECTQLRPCNSIEICPYMDICISDLRNTRVENTYYDSINISHST